MMNTKHTVRIGARSNMIVLLAAVAMTAILVSPNLVPRAASAVQSTTGTWTLYPEQATLYSTAVHPPIKANGTSVFSDNGNNVIPVQFRLFAASGPVVFQSILSDGTDGTFPGTNDFSFLSFRPSPTLTFNQITSLKANYGFTMGNCGGGSLRWSVRVDIGNDGDPSNDGSVFIYYGDYPNFTDCTTNSQSGVNMIGQPDLRYDTSQVGGTFYHSYWDAVELVGTLPVVRATLVIDSGWFAGDQKLNISNVMVNDNTFVPSSGQPAQTCDLPAATIKVTKIFSPGGPITPISVQPHDNDSNFRIVDCKYIYNLATRSLLGAGTYKVEAVIGGNPVAGAAYFTLR